jgi:hypothetical protein
MGKNMTKKFNEWRKTYIDVATASIIFGVYIPRQISTQALVI